MLLRARESFFAGARLIPRGQLVESTDPVVTPDRRQFFEPVEVASATPAVEQATAAPGQVRNVRIPKAKPAK